jgi:lipopolysaccharide heptosyltransferase II
MSRWTTTLGWVPIARWLRRVNHRPVPLREFNPRDGQCLLVISTRAIGDTLMSTPAMHALRQAFPAARLITVMHRRTAPLFEASPDVGRLVPLSRSLMWTAWRLRRERPQVAVVLQGNEPEATLLAYFAGARFIVRHARHHPLPDLLSISPASDLPPEEHIIRACLRRVEALGVRNIQDVRMQLSVSEPARETVSAMLGRYGVQPGEVCIGFQVGAATRYKMWPATAFMLLAHQLLEHRPKLKILLLGTNDERKLCETIRRGVRDHTGAILNLAGAVTLPALPALVQRLSVLVTNDTGTLHVAVALGVPTVSLFASTEPTATGPIQDLDRHRVIKKPQTCHPCVTKRCLTPFCMDQITVDEVLQLTLTQLG